MMEVCLEWRREVQVVTDCPADGLGVRWLSRPRAARVGTAGQDVGAPAVPHYASVSFSRLPLLVCPYVRCPA
jgi:hypothetical protein